MKDAEEYLQEQQVGWFDITDSGESIDLEYLAQLLTDFSKSQQGEMVRVDENGDEIKLRYSLDYMMKCPIYDKEVEQWNKARQIPLAQYELEQKLRLVTKERELFMLGLQQAKDKIERLREENKNYYEFISLIRGQKLRSGKSTTQCDFILNNLSPPSNEQMKGSGWRE